MSKFEKDAIQLYECPVCMNYMSPPIHQCAAGHAFCKECYDKVNVCPQCRGPKGVACAYIMERLYMKLTFPCRYAIDGCEFSAKGQYIRSHEETCDFTPRLCPLRRHSACCWQGTTKEIVDHCKLRHPQFIYFENVQKFTSSGLKWETSTRHAISILYLYDTVFRFYWYLEARTGFMKFSVNYYGPPVKEDEFMYEVRILKAGTNEVVVKIGTACLCLTVDHLATVGNNWVKLPLEMVKDSFSEDGDMHYSVAIRKKSSCGEQNDNCGVEQVLFLAPSSSF